MEFELRCRLGDDEAAVTLGPGVRRDLAWHDEEYETWIDAAIAAAKARLADKKKPKGGEER
jgi:hypothetical protein